MVAVATYMTQEYLESDSSPAVRNFCQVGNLTSPNKGINRRSGSDFDPDISVILYDNGGLKIPSRPTELLPKNLQPKIIHLPSLLFSYG